MSWQFVQSDVEEFIKVRLAKVLDLRGTVRLFCIEVLHTNYYLNPVTK